MRQENLDKIHNFWAKSLGCPKQKLEQPGTGIFTRQKTTDYTSQHNERKVDIFLMDRAQIVSCDEKHLSEVEKLEEHIPEMEISERSLQKAGITLKEILGPAFLSFTDSKNFQSVKTPNCRRLRKSDSGKLEKLKLSSDNEEIGNSIAGHIPERDNLYGKFKKDDLVAVSGYEVWDDEIAFVYVFVSRKYRGKGYGKQVVSKAVEKALNNDLIPCYRTVEEWKSSVNLAKALGFEKYASTYLLELEER